MRWLGAKVAHLDSWRPPTERSVAIQTTIGQLRSSLPEGVEVLPVRYDHGSDGKTPSLLWLATQERPMFAYQHEIRVLSLAELHTSDKNPPGRPIGWDSSTYVEAIRVHPESDDSFMETVVETVRQLAPALETPSTSPL